MLTYDEARQLLINLTEVSPFKYQIGEQDRNRLKSFIQNEAARFQQQQAEIERLKQFEPKFKVGQEVYYINGKQGKQKGTIHAFFVYDFGKNYEVTIGKYRVSVPEAYLEQADAEASLEKSNDK